MLQDALIQTLLTTIPASLSMFTAAGVIIMAVLWVQGQDAHFTVC